MFHESVLPLCEKFFPLDIYWVILFVCEFLSTCRAAVSSVERVADALTAEKVAALCGDHESTALDDLKMGSKPDI